MIPPPQQVKIGHQIGDERQGGAGVDVVGRDGEKYVGEQIQHRQQADGKGRQRHPGVDAPQPADLAEQLVVHIHGPQEGKHAVGDEQQRVGKTVEKNSAGKHLAVYIKGKGLHKAQPQGELAHKKEQLLCQKYGSGPLAIAEKQSQHQRGAQPVGDEYGGQIDQGSIPLSAPGAQPAEGGGPVRLLTGKS